MRKTFVLICLLIACLLVSGVMFSCVKKRQAVYVISFNTDGGTPIPAQRLSPGQEFNPPDPPTKEGYVFDGWFTDPDLRFPYNPNTFKVNANATLYAKWVDVNLYPHPISVQAIGLSLRVYLISEGIDSSELTEYDADVGLSKLRAVKNDQVTISIKINKEGYQIKSGSLKANGELISDNKFNMPAAPVIITFEIELADFSILIIGASNGIVFADKATAKMGQTVNLQAIPDYGYKVSELKYNSHTVNGFSFVMPAENVIITATFAPISETYYAVNVVHSVGGSVRADKTTARGGEYVGVAFEPQPGYYLSYLAVNGKRLDEPYFLMPEGEATVEAVFSPINYQVKYNITALSGAQGSVYINGESVTNSTQTRFSEGERVTLTASLGTGYELSYFVVNSVPLYGNTFYMPAEDTVVSAVFEKKAYTIKAVSGAGGSIEISSGASAYFGDVIGIIIETDENAVLKPGSLKVNGQPIVGNIFVMPAEDVTVTAEFVLTDANNAGPLYDVSIADTSGGSVTVSKQEAAKNDVLFVTVYPDPGYRLKEGSLKANGEPCGEYFVMPEENVTVTAEFERIYKITVYSGISNGYVYPDKYFAAEGETVSLAVGAVGEYRTDNALICINGERINGLTFTMPAEDVEIRAEFEGAGEIYRVSFQSSPNGSLSSDVARAKAGWAVHIKAIPAAGYRLDYLYYTRNGNAVIISTTFTMPEHDVVISAVFAPEERTLDLEKFYTENRLVYAQNGGKLSYFYTPNAIKGFLQKSGLQSFTGIVEEALEGAFNTDFVALKLSDVTKSPYIAQKIADYLRAKSGLSYSGGLYGEYLLITSCGDTIEDYYMLLSGLTAHNGLVLYTRADGSLGLIYADIPLGQNFLAIPDYVGGKAVTRIGRRAFEKLANLQELRLGNVSVLAAEAFKGLINITELDLSKVRSIGKDALLDCLGLQRFIVANNPVYATDKGGYGLYEKQNNLRRKLIRFAPSAAPMQGGFVSYTIHTECRTVAPYAFYGAALEKLYLGFVETLEDYALYGTKNLIYLNTQYLKTAGYRSIYHNRQNNFELDIHAANKITASPSPIFTVGEGEGSLTISVQTSISLLNQYRNDTVWRVYSESFYLKDSSNWIVYFESNGGSYVNAQQVKKGGSRADRPADPVRQGYIFGGWYTDNGTFVNEYNFTELVTSDLRLYAKWIEA